METNIIHKTDPTWGQTVCQQPLWSENRPIIATSYSWDTVNCDACLRRYSKNKSFKHKKQIEKCMHCGKVCSEREGKVCDNCYNQYTPAMLSDLEG